MKRLLTLFLLLCAATITAFAQMSDDQVIEYVKKQQAAGTSQQQMASDLLKRGVTRQQIERIRKKYSGGDGSEGDNAVSGSDDDRMRRPYTDDLSAEDIENSFLNDNFMSKRIFGHDIFRSKALTFEPNMNIATPAHYTLGPGDEVIIDIYGASQTSSKLKVSPDGNITIPKMGPLSVAGLTVDQAQSQVRSMMGKHYQGSSIKVTVGQTRSVIVNVMGEVKTPGTYTLSAFSTVFNALHMAGGITELGTLRNIKVSRNGRVISTIDVYDYITSGRLTGNVMLQDNDVILVGPYENLVEITGRVKRPMFYEMKKNESLQSAINLTGGFTGSAFKEKIRVQRIGSEGMTVHNVDEFDFSSFMLEDEDVIIVDSIIDRYNNTVSIAGAVFRPGKYKLDGRLNSVKTLIEQAGGITEQAFTNRAVIQRRNENRTWQTLSFNVSEILKGNTPDITLQNEDSIIIASNETLLRERNILISGPVMFPGYYSYSENETVEELIIRAGGLRENASLVNVEIARRYVDKNKNNNFEKLADIYQIELRNGLPLEGESSLILQPYDVVTIYEAPDYHGQEGIYVNGEVNYSGLYILSSKSERLSDLVRRAGGLTSKAYVEGARLTRLISEAEKQIQMELLEMHNNDSIATPEDKIKDRYNVGINLAEALRNPGCDQDIILRGEDRLIIPQLTSTVRINGEVLRPNTVAYIKGKKPSYYINEAGGYKRNSDKRRAYIMYANGQISRLSKGKVEPGCEIIVPEKNNDKAVDVSKVSQWASISATLATVAAIIVSITK